MSRSRNSSDRRINNWWISSIVDTRVINSNRMDWTIRNNFENWIILKSTLTFSPLATVVSFRFYHHIMNLQPHVEASESSARHANIELSFCFAQITKQWHRKSSAFFANFSAPLPVPSDKSDFHRNINQIGMKWFIAFFLWDKIAKKLFSSHINIYSSGAFDQFDANMKAFFFSSVM